MRIISGINKGRSLVSLGKGDPSANLRPTSDRVRESIFNLLAAGRFGNRLENCRILDLFAGTGALGLEALSRGATSVVFVDNGAHALQLLRKNIAICGAKNITQVIKTDATQMSSGSSSPPLMKACSSPVGKPLMVNPESAGVSSSVSFK